MFLDKFKPYVLYIKIGLGVVVISAITYFINDYLDTKKALKQQMAMTSTLQSDFKQVGLAYQTTNEIIKKNQEAQSQATALLGEQMVKYMNANNAQLQTLYSSIGKINLSIIDLTRVVGGTRDSAGVVKDVKLSQERPNSAPPLTTLSLNYDPNKPLGQAFSGSKWQNNQEVFKTAFGEWKLKDNGYRVAARLTREVYDGTGKLIGTEEIPLQQAEAQFTPSAFSLGPEIPRFTFTPVIGYDFNDKKWKPGALGGYRISNKADVTGGFVGSTAIVGFGFKFNIKP